jgi:hypothetical protein
LVLAFVAGRLSAPDPFRTAVQRIRETPQTRDGEIVDNLTLLGPEGVAAIGRALAEPDDFPMTYVQALERIGDPRGAEPILAFVAKQAPYVDPDDSHLTAWAVRSLKGTRSSRACPPLTSIFGDATAHLRVRLAAAGALANLCPQDAGEARAFIVREFRARIGLPLTPNPDVTPSELYAALIDVDTAESQAMLLEVMFAEQPMNYIVDPVVNYFATKRGDSVEAALTAVMENPLIDDIGIRLNAARGLLDMNGPSPELADSIRGLQNSARANCLSSDVVWDAERLTLQAMGLF